jgi:hypothetical protein
MTDPTFDAAAERLQQIQIRVESGEFAGETQIEPTIHDRQDVIARLQSIFVPDHLPSLTETEFRSFLMLRNNKHWSGLHRLGPRMCADMDRLRQGLQLLLYSDRPIAERYDEAIAGIDGMGRAVATAILLTVHPQHYGVWNAKSEAGIKMLNLWPRFDRGESEGSRYTRINALLLRLSQALQVDLWTLDALWHYLTLEQDDAPLIEDEIEEAPPPVAVVAAVAEHRFGLERHLHDFLWDNWDETDLGREWERYTEPGMESAGYEYPCDVGRIDILARHRRTRDWLVVELKRAQTSDGTLGQVLRYMGWVQAHLAEGDEQVKGLIIGREWDKNLYYAVKFTPSVDVMRYRVHFSLEAAAQPAEATR